MAAGEYVSVSSQADTEHADLDRERRELATDAEAEHRELAAIYVSRGLQPALATEVANQLMAQQRIGSPCARRTGPVYDHASQAGSGSCSLRLQLCNRSGIATVDRIADTSGTGRRDCRDDVVGVSRRTRCDCREERRCLPRQRSHPRHAVGSARDGSDSGCRLGLRCFITKRTAGRAATAGIDAAPPLIPPAVGPRTAHPSSP